jgi:hypothetical protein
MIRRIFYVVLSLYLFCAGLLVIDPNRWAEGRQQGFDEDHYAGLWPAQPEPSARPMTPVAKPSPRTVRSIAGAVHAGETPLRLPPPVKVVQSNLATVHAGETPLRLPPPVKVVQSNLAAVHAGETPIRLTISVPIPVRKPALPSAVASAGTGAVTEPKVAKFAPTREAGPRVDRSKRKKPEKVVTERPRRIEIARAATETTAPDLRRSRRMTTTVTSTAEKPSRRMRAGEGDEVRRAVGQLDDNDRRTFRSRCGLILSAPGKFARSHVEICLAAAL